MSKQTKKAFDPNENMNRSDSREFLKLVSLNNFPVNIDQLLSNCNQASAQLPQFKQTIKIKIKSYLPDLFFSSGSHVRPVFYLTKLDKPVIFKYNIEQTRLIASDRSAIHEIVTEVELPVFFKNEMRIFYFYQLETYENGQYLYKTEQLLEKYRFIRYINTSAFLVRKYDSRDLIIPKYIIDDIDGILLFGDLNNLVQMRKNLIELHFPIQFLNDDAILSDHVQFKKIITFFTSCYRSLILLDIKYEDLIKEFLLTEFNKFISVVRTKAVLKSDSDYLSLLAIFYFSRRFEINLDFGEIFRLHNVNRLEYLKKVKDFFLIDDNSINFEDELKSYLDKNRCLSDFNAIIVLYYLKKNKNLRKIKTDSILKLTRGFNEPNSEEILEKANHYKALTDSDPILGGLLLYFFNPNSQLLDKLIKNLPLESFVYHLGYKLLTTHQDEFERVLPKNLITHISWFYGIFQNLTRSQNAVQLKEIRNALLNMIELMINSFSKESDAIVNLIKILIQVNSVSVDFNSHEKTPNMDEIRSVLRTWFENEFNQNILINFGIRNVSSEEIEANKVLINIYRNFSDYFQNYLNFPFKKFEDKNEVKQKIRYFGMNNQHTILSSLKQTGLVDQILNDLFIEQISKNQLTDAILFLINFNFDKYLDIEFREICLQAISDCLIEKKSDQSIRTLCESLKNPQYQHYLDFVLDNFVNKIWPKSEYDELKFSIQKPYFLTLVTIFVNHSKLQLSNPFNLSHINERFHNIIISYKKLINQFVDASISLEGIKLIKSDENNIVSRLNDLIIENFGQDFLVNANNRNFFTKLSQIRYQEKDLFDIYRKNVSKFNDFCSKFCLFQPKITSLLDKQKHLDQSPESNILLNSVCSCINIDDLGKNLNFISSVTYFDGIDSTLMKEIEKILNYGQKYCLLFDSIFDQSSRVLNVQQLDFANSISQTSELAFQKLLQIIASVDQGSVKLTELDGIFYKVFGNKSDKFCAELEYWIRHFKIKNLSLRIEQIKLFVEFKNSYLAAVEMDKIRQQLGLTNQFNELKKILSINEESYEKSVLSDMDSDVENTISILSTVNQTEKLECLNAFTQSLDLVKWLRENTKSLSELKFLVDLASMSGSNNATYDRSLFARALKDSGTAYSTLIYELELDVTFEEFMRQCKQICSHLESDSSIGAKLLEVKDKIDLLDEIKRTTGNVELNAIHEARLINEKGVYKVGLAQRQIKSNFLANFDKKLDLNEIISLQRDGQAFSYSHLKNLQDILMLIVPKNSQLINQDEKSTLDYFIQFLSALNRVGQSYINLWEYSCRFFEIFQIKIYANWSKIANLPSVEINSSSGNLLFTHPELNSLHTVTILCNLIDKTEQEWSSFVAKKRDAYPLLNNFSLKQINFLIKSFELVSIQNLSLRQSDFELVQSLLWNIDQNLSAQKILQAYSDTLNQMSELEPVEMNEYSGLELLFEQQWRAFLAEQNSVNPQSITLTQFASMLACLHEPRCEIRRTLPGYLTKTNGPNLISCPNSELISVILSIYALTPDQPMPTDNEIVFCQPSTTSEQIENFFRLCFNSHCGMIFTLVNIHNLPYKVSNRAEIFLKNYLQKPQTFNLVLTCDIDKESESILASVYLKNRVRYLLLEPDTLQIYIKRYLTKDQNQLLKLGNFDPDNCSVRVITSDKSGNGKSTYVNHLNQRVKEKCCFNHKIIRIKSNSIDTDREIEKIIEYKKFLDENNQLDKSTIYHIDIAYEVFNNVEPYFFSLILGSCMAHSNGLVWRRNSTKDFYLIEVTPPKFTNGRCVHSIIDLLPKIVLATPNQYAYQLRNELGSASTIHRPDRLFRTIHQNIEYQRVCFYLKLLNDYRNRTEGLNRNFVSNNFVVEEEAEANVKRLFNHQIDSNFSELDCLEILLRIFESVEPNWLEIRNYVEFLNSQLILYEKSKILDQVKGFRALCLGLMAVVASNFGLPSLQPVQLDGTNIKLDSYKVDESKKWENLNHPYMILDSTSEKVTFIGVHLNRVTKQFINSNTLQPLTNLTNCFIPAISQGMLIEFLKLRLRLFNNFNEDHRITKTQILSNIMNLDEQRLLREDPDENYQLALDNCLKMIAIYLRFVCKIPVVLMGETGCGKTSLIQYFSKLIRPNNNENLVHMKIHGGTTCSEIESYLAEAERMSLTNYHSLDHTTTRNSAQLITCILFFDEANTTEEIGLIKEIMCDGTCGGRTIDFEHGLKIVAAVNPYRKHSDKMIEKLESAGLGFYVSSSDTKEKLGHIPMRQLVYRVQPLPTSLLPLVWDFGQLEHSVEKVYISQIISEISPELKRSEMKPTLDLMVGLVEQSQKFMRNSEDECSFVSIRDIGRIVTITKWFYSLKGIIFSRMNQISKPFESDLPPLIRSFILSLMICYHSALYNNETRRKYRTMIMQMYPQQVSYDWLYNEIFQCQSIFFDEIVFNQKNIARNSALFENVFMMIVCIELRIPLFIVGKPGSSKSLAKSIVSRAMQGRNSKSTLFQHLKETFFLNFQCSPLTTSEMILNTFQEAAKFQEAADTNRSVAVVNLDEIGLAEGSESMPLKVLHPLLESGVDLRQGQSQRVAVIGISNWALDPAKMNRGLFVSRGEPDIEELIVTAKGICAYDTTVLRKIENYLEYLAKAYLEVCHKAREFKREFFGLRDYYSLIKMIFYFCSKDKILTWSKLEHAVRRNFGGLEIDCVQPFRRLLYSILPNKILPTEPKCDSLSLVESALREEYLESNSRYLLFLTDNNSVIDIALQLGQKCGISMHNLSIIFSSSFRLDQEYTEICRNISLIKHSMEIGRTVVLLNAYNLYESLYDALNQYYFEFAGQKYVDLGLGTHRIKCLVHENFRLIIIAEREAVYDSKRFPIPLINRLEKHFLNADTILTECQKKIVEKIKEWIEERKLSIVGLHSDAVASVVLNLSGQSLDQEDTIRTAHTIILQCASPESVIRQKDTNLHHEYFDLQKHFSLKEMLGYHLSSTRRQSSLVQISSFCKSTIMNLDMDALKRDLMVNTIDFCLLQSFDTQHQFVSRLNQFYSSAEENGVLLIQADLNTTKWDLVSCARYYITEVSKSVRCDQNFHVVLMVLMEKENANFVAFQHGWSCYHLDEIEEPGEHLPDLDWFKNSTLSQILERSLDDDDETMEIDGSSNFSISLLLKKLSHKACSLIRDTNLTRTIHRIDLLNKLCDDKNFVHKMTKRLINLQKEKESNYMNNSQSSLLGKICQNMRENLTLRRSCETYLINRLSPLLAFVLSQVDVYSNMDVLIDSLVDQNWRYNLWLRIFENESLLKIHYSDMWCEESVERQMFDCHSDFVKKNIFDSPANLKPSLPFFWLLISQFNLLHSNLQTCSSPQIQKQMIPRFFSLNPLYQLLNDLAAKCDSTILEYYVRDFLLINCEIRSQQCLDVLSKFLLQSLSESDTLNIKLAMVHCFFHSEQSKCQMFCKFANLQPGIEDHIETVNNLDIEACKLSFSEFKKLSTLNNFHIEKDYFDKIYDLSQLVGQLVSTKMDENIFELYQVLCALKYFINMVRKYASDFEHLKDQNSQQYHHLLDLFGQLSSKYFEFFSQNVDFKSEQSIQLMHKFIIHCDTMLSNQLPSAYLKECLSSFYLDIIDNICFNKLFGKDTSNECIKCILEVVTSKKIDQLFEINFMHRSLIIQIIFKNHGNIVRDHLTNWFHSKSYIGNDLFSSSEEVSILYINCVLDGLITESIDKSIEQQLATADQFSRELVSEEELLKRTIKHQKIRYSSFEVQSLILISKFKFCVSIFNKYIYSEKVYEQVKETLLFQNLNKNLQDLIHITIHKLNTHTFIKFLIKDLVRKYGSASVKYVMKNDDINWVTPEELVGNNDSVIDRYVLLDDPYVLTKKAILDCFSSRSPQPLNELLEQKKTSEPYLCLGLYQNVTILAKNMSDSIQNLTSIFEQWFRSTFPNETKIFAPLLNNSFSNLFKVNDENWRDIDLTVILVQLKYSILYSKLSIIEPLRKILTQPMLIQNFYLPTMPQDNLFDIKIALQSRSSTNKFYSCPNGHIYVIGDCGRPWIMDKCKTCGEAIGGEQHRLVSDNSLIDDSIHDKTMKGYCIQNLCNRAENMRSLNMTGFFYQRFLIDACMYLALGDEGQNKEQVMSGMCHKENDLGAFFLIRIKNDLALLASELNLNMDEIYLLLHLSVKKFLSYNSETKEFSFDTKAKRQDWEENFYEMFFANILENLNKELSESNRKIREKNQEFTNKENNQSALYFMAYELIPMVTSKDNYLYENELFWKYRPTISFDLISKEFAKVQQNKNNYAILSKFIEINSQLELLVNLGLIMQMVNLFKSEHNKNISKSKARAESLGEYLSSISMPKWWSMEKIKLCVNAYQNTWLFIQPKISEYMLKNFPKQNLSVQFQHSFGMTTKLSYFLPTLSGDGFLSYLMIHYMAKIQNEMLEQCKKKMSHIPTKSAQLFDDQSQLITFDKQSDLLRVLQSNFSYKSKELKFVFRYESIENQIMDKYMRSKAQIDLNSIPIFEYSDEISYFRTFKLLNEQVVQQSLRLGQMAEIMDDFKNISEISEALNTLRLIIDYTIVTSLDPNDSLVDFLKKIYSGSLLKQTEAILKTKILEYGRLKNLKVIWILLITKKSILSTISGQDPFESLDDRFKIETKLKLDLNMDKASLISLTVILYQIIVFFLSTKIGDDINIYSIKDMFDSLESLDGVIMLENFNFPEKLNNQISQEIKMDSIYSIWKRVCLQWN